MGRFRSQMISVRDLLRKMRSHAVISVLSAVGLATIGCGFVVFSAIDELDTATYATKVIEEGDQVSIVYADSEEAAQTKNMLTLMQNTMEEVRKQVRENHVAVERAEDAVVSVDERAQRGFEATAEQIDGITAHMNNSMNAVQELGRKVEEGNRSGEGFLQNILNNMSAVDSSLSVFGDNMNGRFADTDEKLNRLLEQLELSNQNIVVLQTQLDEARKEIEALKGMVTNVGDAQNTLGITILETEQRRTEDYDALKQMIDTNAANITTVSNRVPFALGIDGEGEYGYVKEGADAVIPFRHPGPQTGDAAGIAHIHAQGTGCYRTSVSMTTRSCNGTMSSYGYANCTKCGEGPQYCSANPACAKGGSHSMGATLYRCSSCGYQRYSGGGTCGNTISVPTTVSTLNCARSTCGRIYIENGYYRTGRRECPLAVICVAEDAGMSIAGCAWRAEDGGVISGDANGVTVTAAHNGLYICTVTLRDNVSGAITQQEVSYRVINLIK
ncbi:MAG: hypothetical protein IJR00_01020 [Lachnospiraceae bacterium]|nr:hypothetical protein [Lachnospiraceae bacterium]